MSTIIRIEISDIDILNGEQSVKVNEGEAINIVKNVIEKNIYEDIIVDNKTDDIYLVISDDNELAQSDEKYDGLIALYEDRLRKREEMDNNRKFKSCEGIKRMMNNLPTY